MTDLTETKNGQRISRIENTFKVVKIIATIFGLTGIVIVGFIFKAFNSINEIDARASNILKELKVVADSSIGLIKLKAKEEKKKLFVDYSSKLNQKLNEIGIKDYKIIYGFVDRNRDIIQTDQYIIRKLGIGHYRIDFNAIFESKPFILAIAENNSIASIKGENLQFWNRSTVFIDINHNGGSFGSSDANWGFIVIGKIER